MSSTITKKDLKDMISSVNGTLIHYKKGGWIDCRRTPDAGEEMIYSLEQFIDARFNREAWNIPELQKAEDYLGGRLFSCTLEEPDEIKKKYKQATLTLIRAEDIIEPSEELIKLLDEVRIFLGGTKIVFNSVKVKIKFSIED
jgi:hypothetical protein